MFSLNPPGVIVVHKDVSSGGGVPLCGFLTDNLDGVAVSETVTGEWSQVTCLDCNAAYDDGKQCRDVDTCLCDWCFADKFGTGESAM